MTIKDENYVPMDFVYIGKRMTIKDERVCVVRIINPDGTLGQEAFYDYSKKIDRVVGGVYTGATFAGGNARGLASSTYVKQWTNKADRIEWTAKDEQTEADLKVKRLEKDAGRVSDIEQTMLPLRELYDAARKRRDYGTMEALERAVIRALHSTPRVSE